MWGPYTTMANLNNVHWQQILNSISQGWNHKTTRGLRSAGFLEAAAFTSHVFTRCNLKSPKNHHMLKSPRIGSELVRVRATKNAKGHVRIRSLWVRVMATKNAGVTHASDLSRSVSQGSHPHRISVGPCHGYQKSRGHIRIGSQCVRVMATKNAQGHPHVFFVAPGHPLSCGSSISPIKSQTFFGGSE